MPAHAYCVNKVTKTKIKDIRCIFLFYLREIGFFFYVYFLCLVNKNVFSLVLDNCIKS